MVTDLYHYNSCDYERIENKKVESGSLKSLHFNGLGHIICQVHLPKNIETEEDFR